MNYTITHIGLIDAAAAAAKSLQSCLTLCNPIDGSPPGFPVPGILQTRTLEWVAIAFSATMLIDDTNILGFTFSWVLRAAQFSSVQFSRSVMSDSLRAHESQHARPPCPSPTPKVHSNSRPLGQ